MLAGMSLPLFLEWMDYNDREPFGEERADLRCGIIAHVIASVNARKGKRYKVSDFMPKFDQQSGGSRRPKQTTAQMQATFLAFAEAQNKMMLQKKPKELPRKSS